MYKKKWKLCKIIFYFILFYFNLQGFSLTDTGVPPVDVHESEALVTFTDEAPESVHALSATRTHAPTQETLVDV